MRRWTGRTPSVSSSSRAKARLREEMWLEDKYFEVMNDPRKRAKWFKITWIVAYSMLILGFALILWVLLR